MLTLYSANEVLQNDCFPPVRGVVLPRFGPELRFIDYEADTRTTTQEPVVNNA